MKDDEKDIQVQEGEEVAGKTIVGGRPLKRREVRMSIPAGIEKTLYKASIDSQFRERLMQDRFGAIQAYGFHLTENERQMLSAIPDSRLETIISRIQPEEHGKRKFMRAVATAVVTLAAGTSAVLVTEGCNHPKGATADPPSVTSSPADASSAADTAQADPGIPIATEEMMTGGAAPDEVEIFAEPPAPGGAVPDLPEELPQPDKAE